MSRHVKQFVSFHDFVRPVVVWCPSSLLVAGSPLIKGHSHSLQRVGNWETSRWPAFAIPGGFVGAFYTKMAMNFNREPSKWSDGFPPKWCPPKGSVLRYRPILQPQVPIQAAPKAETKRRSGVAAGTSQDGFRLQITAARLLGPYPYASSPMFNSDL